MSRQFHMQIVRKAKIIMDNENYFFFLWRRISIAFINYTFMTLKI